MQADWFSLRIKEEYLICYEFYKFIRGKYIQTLFN